jgi:UDP-N-acetylglucosamine acyltransferase
MSMIDPTARVADGAVIGEGAQIGPYCIIGPDVVIGQNCKLIAHVHITAQTTLGDGCTIYPFASLGTPPQSLSYRGELTKLEIGAGCTIRESVTMNAGTVAGGGITRVGERGYFMNCSHVGHDCHVGNDVIFATSATLGGHCEIGDHVFVGGLSAVHQFTRIGPQVMVGGVCGVRGDVIPFGLVNGQYAVLEGLNIIGMKRRRFTRERLATVRAFYQKLFLGGGVFAERLASVKPLASEDPAIAEILAFIDDGKHRPLCLPADDNRAFSSESLPRTRSGVGAGSRQENASRQETRASVPIQSERNGL